MKQGWIGFLSLALMVGMNSLLYADQTIVAQKVDQAPMVDGKDNETVWQKAKAIVTHDKIANIKMTLKAIYTDKEIFFLVTFPDANESREHKTLFWDKESKTYKTGPKREDCFVFKWNMESMPTDLSLYSDKSYVADIWFWKAKRTDPVGYADDKIQTLTFFSQPLSKKTVSKNGTVFYLVRRGDEGDPAYKIRLINEFQGDNISKFEIVAPSGSRADIKAKGVWLDGKWTIEFGRALNTGNPDDVPFTISENYTFGVSRYEIAGREPNKALSQPLYGAGDVSEALTLKFSK